MIGQAYRLYERRMLDANSMDFDDLLMRTVNVLELFEDVRRRYRERFRWVLVDEYQDTNHAQYRLLQLLCGEDGNLSSSVTTASRSTASGRPTSGTSWSSIRTFLMHTW